MSGDEDARFYAPHALMSSAGMRRAWRERPVSTFFATGLGIGMMPFAPGTWGSVEGLAIGFLAASIGYPGLSPAGGFWFLCIIGLATAGFGVIVSGRAEARCDARDPGPIVVDEVAGQILAFAPAWFRSADLASGYPWWLFFGAPFALFRLFDIWKPGPIRKLQDLPGGWGIVADDVAAGLAAGVLTFVIGLAWR